MHDFNRRMGYSIRRIRGDKTQQWIAEQMNRHGYATWSQRTVSRLENGNRSLLVEEASVLADVLNVSINDLIDEPAAQLAEAIGKLRADGMAFFAAAVQFHGAQREARSIAYQRRVSPTDMRLGPIDRDLFTLPIDVLASLALSEVDEKVEISPALADDSPERRRPRIKSRGKGRDGSNGKH